MIAVIKPCALCLKEKPLKNSHLVPKAIYRRLKRRVARDLGSPALTDPVTGTTVLTDSQPTLPLLCFECEQLFSANGENTVIRELRDPKHFILRDKCLESVKVLRSKDDPPNALLDRKAYLYFSISLAWRMSVANWAHPYNTGYKRLGPYEEKMRKWLHGDTHIMDKVYAEILVDTDSNSPALGGPDVSSHSDLSSNANIYQLTALGVWFRVHVGGKLSKTGRDYMANGRVPIAYEKVSFGGMGMGNYVNGLTAKTKYKGKLAKLR